MLNDSDKTIGKSSVIGKDNVEYYWYWLVDEEDEDMTAFLSKQIKKVCDNDQIYMHNNIKVHNDTYVKTDDILVDTLFDEFGNIVKIN